MLFGPNQTIAEFYPHDRETAPLPSSVPDGIVAEYREADLCASVGAYRAASALLRSALEKTLRHNGYQERQVRLQQRIDLAANDHILTAARQRRAHENVRDPGNDILHDDWRAVDQVEYASAHLYVQRILEDFYDHRQEVEVLLTKAGRLKPPIQPPPNP